MPKTYELTIDRFDGGFSNDPRTSDYSKCAISSHFDIFTFPRKLVPQRMTEADEVKQYFLTKFLYAQNNYGTKPPTFKLFGLGVVSGDTITGKVEVYEYPIDSGIDQLWVNGANGAAAAGSRDLDVFFYYRGFIYGWTGNAIWKFDTSRAASFVDTWNSVTRDTVCQPVHHPDDDIAYFFSDNKVHKLNNTTWTANVLTLPDNLKITAATEFGPYLALGCTTIGTARVRSIVYIWDRDSSLATVTARIDFGEGSLKHLASLNNKLIGVMDYYTTSAYSMTEPKVLVKQASNEFAVTLNEISLDAISTVADGGSTFPATRVVKDNKLYFPLKAPLGSDNRHGIWVVDEFGKATIWFVEEEATSYQGIFNTGNVWFVAHSYDGSVNRSDDNYAYSATLASVYETVKFDANIRRKKKKLLGVNVTTDALPAAGQVVLKYKADGETSWTTIFTNGTDNSVSHSAVNIESSGANLPEFYEIQFRLESTGGAVITSLNFKAEILDKDLYD